MDEMAEHNPRQVNIINIQQVGNLQYGLLNTMNFLNHPNTSHFDPEHEDEWGNEDEYDVDIEAEHSENLDVTLDSNMIRFISEEIAYRWYKMGEELNIPEAELNDLHSRYDSETVEEKAFQVLELWKSKHDKPTVEKLVTILNEQLSMKSSVLKGFKKHNQSNNIMSQSPMSLEQGAAEN